MVHRVVPGVESQQPILDLRDGYAEVGAPLGNRNPEAAGSETRDRLTATQAIHGLRRWRTAVPTP